MDRAKKSRNVAIKKLPADWADPKTSDDLPVDPKRLSDIKQWLNANRGKNGILVISGPTGSAKTASVRIKAKEAGYNIAEWVTPLDREFSAESDDVFQSQAGLFEDFLYSSSRYRSLFSIATSQLVLVEDYPNVFLRDPGLFHEILKRHRDSARSPAVFICSEVADRNLKLMTDLFPSTIQAQLGITHITMNPVTRTKMLAAVRRMSQILQKLQPGFASISSDTCNDVVTEANGDIRFATLTLQMGVMKTNPIDYAAIFDNPMKRFASKPKDSLSEAVKTCGKDDKVGLLHAVGRVLYPKLAGESPAKKSNVLGKRKRKETNSNKRKDGSLFVHDPAILTDSYLSSASMFVLFIQENYLNTFSSIDSVAQASFHLSESDVMMTAEGVETPHDLSLYLTLSGVMLANKVPNRAWNPVRRPRYLDSLNDLKDLRVMMPLSISLTCLSTSTIMKDYVSYVYKLPNSNLTGDQKLFLESKVCSNKAFSNCQNMVKSMASTAGIQQPQKSVHSNNSNPDDAELHISDSESDCDPDKSNMSDDSADDKALLAAADAAEKEFDYGALLLDGDDDVLLASQQ